MMNMGMQELSFVGLHPFGYTPKSGIAGPQGRFIFTFLFCFLWVQGLNSGLQTYKASTL
jgi:hypothetical protein